MSKVKLWFDVEMIRYTTLDVLTPRPPRLWFDVEMIRYTTNFKLYAGMVGLWFDVEMIRYTTVLVKSNFSSGCGLM